MSFCSIADSFKYIRKHIIHGFKYTTEFFRYLQVSFTKIGNFNLANETRY